jgi:hypothetical protein
MLTICNSGLKGIANRLRHASLLPRFGAIAGALGGAAYALESSTHMVVNSAVDTWIVGAMLTAIGACLGWLAGALVQGHRARVTDRGTPPAGLDRAEPDRERA